MMGGLVRSSKDIDSLIKSCKSIRSKKEKRSCAISFNLKILALPGFRKQKFSDLVFNHFIVLFRLSIFIAE
jgi:hypothetical protein